MLNKLTEYLETNPISDASEKAQVSKNTLLSISRMDAKALLGVRLKTYLKIKNKLGVDLMEEQEFNLEDN